MYVCIYVCKYVCMYVYNMYACCIILYVCMDNVRTMCNLLTLEIVKLQLHIMKFEFIQ